MREGCYRHCVTVDPSGGVAFSYLVIIKSMTHTLPCEVECSKVQCGNLQSRMLQVESKMPNTQ
jgi:hypothetical protein